MIIKQFVTAAMSIALMSSIPIAAGAYHKAYPHFEHRQTHHKYHRPMYLHKVKYHKVKRHKYHHHFRWHSRGKAHNMLKHNRYYAKTRWHGRYKQFPMHVGIEHHHKRLHWQRAKSGYVPYGAVVSGHKNGYPYYTCKARLHRAILPGKLFTARGCYIKHNGDWHVRGHYLVLVR